MNDGTNKIITGRKNSNEQIEYFKFVQIGEVVSIIDPNGLGRIKVRIKGPRSKGGDDGITDNDLPWCFPLLPKFISPIPQVKEAVFILIFDKNRQHADRLFVGSIISQSPNLQFDPYYMSALAGFTFGSESPNVNVNTIPNLNGVFPNPEDISIQGRYNTDITQKKNEVIIRAGKFETTTPDKNNPYPISFNAKTQAYIQIKNDVITQQKTTTQEQQKGSVINLVGNKINLLSHSDANPKFNLTNQTNLISDEEMSNIFNQSHPLLRGDLTLEYLKLMKNALLYHVHNGHGNSATDLTTSGNKQSIKEFLSRAEDLEKQMLSNNIRIN